MLKKETKDKLDNIRIEPHSADAGEAVLGSMLIDPSCKQIVDHILEPDDFYIIKNQWVMDVLLHLDQIDFLTI